MVLGGHTRIENGHKRAYLVLKGSWVVINMSQVATKGP